jgi:hypothetical protein
LVADGGEDKSGGNEKLGSARVELSDHRGHIPVVFGHSMFF